MKMVFHQAKGVNLEAGFLASLGQGFDKIMAVAIINEDGFPTISPAQDMIDRPGILDAQLPWHRPIVPQCTERGKRKTVQIYGLTPLTL